MNIYKPNKYPNSLLKIIYVTYNTVPNENMFLKKQYKIIMYHIYDK